MAKKPSTKTKSKPSPPESPEVAPPQSDEARTVDRMLIALQKTLSRVSRDSAGVPEGQARSLIVGSVAFDLSVRCTLTAEEKLLLDDEKGNPLTLRGQIVADVGVQVKGEVGQPNPNSAPRPRPRPRKEGE